LSSFEFLSVLISVVVGLGIANLLTGIGRLVHRHRHIRVSITFLAWTLFVFNFLVIYWWTVVFGWQSWQNWNLLVFMFVLCYGILLFLLSVILFPVDMPEKWDPHSHFIDLRRWFFGIFIGVIFVEALDSYLKNHLDSFSTPYYSLLGLWIIVSGVGWSSENRRTQNVVSIVALASQLAWFAYQLRDLEWSVTAPV